MIPNCTALKYKLLYVNHMSSLYCALYCERPADTSSNTAATCKRQRNLQILILTTLRGSDSMNSYYHIFRQLLIKGFHSKVINMLTGLSLMNC